MNVSPTWWLNHRSNNDKIIKYVIEKFSRDYYPRVVLHSRERIDLDDPKNFLNKYVTTKIRNGEFTFEFIPEEEKRKLCYTIRNGYTAFEQNLRKQEARLKISVKVPA
jgi:hypothetical protein